MRRFRIVCAALIILTLLGETAFAVVSGSRKAMMLRILRGKKISTADAMALQFIKPDSRFKGHLSRVAPALDHLVGSPPVAGIPYSEKAFNWQARALGLSVENRTVYRVDSIVQRLLQRADVLAHQAIMPNPKKGVGNILVHVAPEMEGTANFVSTTTRAIDVEWIGANSHLYREFKAFRTGSLEHGLAADFLKATGRPVPKVIEGNIKGVYRIDNLPVITIPPALPGMRTIGSELEAVARFAPIQSIGAYTYGGFIVDPLNQSELIPFMVRW